jgi:glutamate 5-kinase
MNNILFRKELPKVKTIVIKTGSRILTSSGHEQRVKRLVEDLVTLKRAVSVPSWSHPVQ